MAQHLISLLEDEEIDDDDDESEPGNPLVDALFEQVEDLRVRVSSTDCNHYLDSKLTYTQLYESEVRCALIEAETRDEVMREMEDRMMRMERMFTKRLMNEVKLLTASLFVAIDASQLEENQLKTDRKIDMLHQAGLIGAARHPEQDLNDLEDELGVEESLVSLHMALDLNSF